MPTTDFELLNRLNGSSGQGPVSNEDWSAFYAKYVVDIIRKGRAFGLSEADAEDLWQVTVLDLWQKARNQGFLGVGKGKYNPEQKRRFWSFLVTTYRGKVSNHIRKETLRQSDGSALDQLSESHKDQSLSTPEQHLNSAEAAEKNEAEFEKEQHYQKLMDVIHNLRHENKLSDQDVHLFFRIARDSVRPRHLANELKIKSEAISQRYYKIKEIIRRAFKKSH